MYIKLKNGKKVFIPHEKLGKNKKALGGKPTTNIDSILMANKNVPFVQRIMNPSIFPTLQNEDGTVSSHSLMFGESDGKYVVYPSILNEKGKVKRVSNEEAWNYAKTNNDFITFDNEKDASDFAGGSWKEWQNKNGIKSFGAGALIGGGLGLVNTLLQNKMKKDLMEQQKQGSINQLVALANRNEEEDKLYYANNPELIQGVDKNIQAMGKKGDPENPYRFDPNSFDESQEENVLKFVRYLNSHKGDAASKIAKEVVNLRYGKELTPEIKQALKKTEVPTRRLARSLLEYGEYDHNRASTDKSFSPFTQELHKIAYQNYLKSGNIPVEVDAVSGADVSKKAMGGKGLNPLSSDTSLVNAGSHESGNDLNMGNMTVEGGEVVDNKDNVYTDRMNLITPADHAKSLSLIKGILERASRKLSTAQKGDIQKAIDNIDKELNQTIDTQEATKDVIGINDDGSKKAFGNMGPFIFPEDAFKKQQTVNFSPTVNNDSITPTLSSNNNNQFNFWDSLLGIGSDLSEEERKKAIFDKVKGMAGLGVDLGVSVIDNIINNKLLNQTPNVPTPVLDRPAKFKTSINVEPQLSQVRESTTKVKDAIDESTVSSNAAIQRKMAANTQGTKMINEILANKENVETDLTNRASANRQQVDAINSDKVNAFNRDKYLRDVNILSAKSQNISNLSRDVVDVINKNRMFEFQNQQLVYDALKYSDTGTFSKALFAGSYDSLGKDDKQKLLTILKDSGRTSDYDAAFKRWF